MGLCSSKQEKYVPKSFVEETTTTSSYTSAETSKKANDSKAARVFFNKQENRSAKEEKEEKAMDTPLSALSFPSNLTEITLAENDTSWLRGSTELDAKMATDTFDTSVQHFTGLVEQVRMAMPR